MRQISIEIRYTDLRSQRVNVSIEGEDPFDWTKDSLNAYKLWALTDLPFALVQQLMRFIRINPERQNSLNTNRFNLNYFPEDNLWEAVTTNLSSLDGKRHFLSIKVANFDPKENYQMEL